MRCRACPTPSARPRGRRCLVGRRFVHRQSRLGEAARLRAGETVAGGEAFLAGPVDELCAHARRLEDQLGMARPAARGLGVSQSASKFFGDDHSEGIWRARLLAPTRIRKWSASCRRARSDRGRHRDGAELARARRTADAASAPRSSSDHWLPRLADGREIPCFGLTSPEAGSDAASMIDTGVICKGTFEGTRSARPPAQLAQALHHARPGRDLARARLQGLRPRSSGRSAATSSASPSR